ncbi:hypothetical protein V8J88_04720 [Massilia sp. W12]|uniref:hypothetical protein n=1 Tax=Massilia sp. W12 TaxID=3126507 RepID=UPI0030CA8DEA
MRELISSPELGRFTQGAILNCLKVAEKQKAFGLVISARCDIAHRKSKTILCLPIYSLTDWLEQIGRSEIIESSKKVVDEIPHTVLKKFGLSTSSFRIYGYETTIEVLTKNGATPKDIQNVEMLRSYLEGGQLNPKVKAFKDPYNKLLESLWRNSRMDSHFIERIQLNEPSVGYIVDFTQPITLARSLLDELAVGIEKFKFDRDPTGVYGQLFLDDLEQGEIVSVLRSPYIEHILQRFTHYYSRIGTADIDITELTNLKARYEIR